MDDSYIKYRRNFYFYFVPIFYSFLTLSIIFFVTIFFNYHEKNQKITESVTNIKNISLKANYNHTDSTKIILQRAINLKCWKNN